MKKYLLIYVLFATSLIGQSQTTRFFEFRVTPNGNWVDTSFVVATSDTTLINDVLNEIKLPQDQRRFVSGGITKGHGGFNHNADHEFKWHFVPNEWALYFANVEFCDGPLSGLDSHEAILAGDTGYFCPWSSYPHQEVANPRLKSVTDSESKLLLYPNPASDILNIDWPSDGFITVTVYNALGQLQMISTLSKAKNYITIDHLSSGVYFIEILEQDKKVVKEICIQKP